MRFVSVRELRSDLAEHLRRLRSGPALVMRASTPVAVLMTPSRYDALIRARTDLEDAVAAYIDLAARTWLPALNAPPPGRDVSQHPLAKGVHPYGADSDATLSPGRTAELEGGRWVTAFDLCRETPGARLPAFAEPSTPLWLSEDVIRTIREGRDPGSAGRANCVLRAAGGMTGDTVHPLSQRSTNDEGPWRISAFGHDCILVRHERTSYVLTVRERERAPTTVGARQRYRRRRSGT